MERRLFRVLKAELRRIGRRRTDRRQTHTDATIVEVYFWGVHHDRSTNWACQSENWAGVRRRASLPSQPTMSRRLCTESVQRLIEAIERRLRRAQQQNSIVFMLDGKVLQIGPHSRDPDATWGRVMGGKGKGYKLHLLMAGDGTVVAWHIAPLNVHERTIARILLKRAKCVGYILADANYDANHLHDLALRFGGQLVSPRRKSSRGTQPGHRRHSKGRLRSIAMLEDPASTFGSDLYTLRPAIERKFGYLTSTPGLLTHLPAWVRILRRVRMWVQAKLILADLRAAIKHETGTSAA